MSNNPTSPAPIHSVQRPMQECLGGTSVSRLAANEIYLVTVTPQAVGNDVGGVGLLGVVTLLITSVVFSVVLPAAYPVGAGRLDIKHESAFG